MADELKIQIPKSEWRQGVARSLGPELRKMADTFGLDMATAQAAQGVIWLRGEAAKIEAAKATLKGIVEEYFPESDMPEELGGESAATAPAAAAPAPAAKSPVAKPKPAPKSPVAAPALAPAAKKATAKTPAAEKPSALSRLNPFAKKAKAKPSKPAAPAEPPVVPFLVAARPSSLPGGELLWLCTVKNSSFRRKCKGTHWSGSKQLVMSAEPGNIGGTHSYKYSTIAHPKSLGVSLAVHGLKETVLVTTPAKFRRPKGAVHVTGVPKCAKRGIPAIRRFGAVYRRDLLAEAKSKYLKVLTSFKKKKPAVRSRRSKK